MKQDEKQMKKRPRRFNKSSENKVTPRTFSNINFTNCRCDSILITAYIQILNHCHGIGIFFHNYFNVINLVNQQIKITFVSFVLIIFFSSR